MQPPKGRLHVPRRSQEQLSVQSQHPNSFQRGFLWVQLEESQEIHCNANANKSQLEEPSGATSPGLKQLFSCGQEEARGYLKTSLETGFTWLPSSNSHHEELLIHISFLVGPFNLICPISDVGWPRNSAWFGRVTWAWHNLDRCG